MIKLKDFARQHGISDRQVQRQLVKYEKELEGHFERQGTNGTWLDEEACEFLRSKMKKQPLAVIEGSDFLAKIDAIEAEKEDYRIKYEQALEALNAAKDKMLEMQESQVKLEAAEQKQLLLEERRAEDLAQIQELKAELERFVPTWFGRYKKKG